jgi:hypothetical protein
MPKGKRRAVWSCRCDCGDLINVAGDGLRNTQSCGCLHYEVKSTHGASGKGAYKRCRQAYRAWTGMKDRCYRPSYNKYSRYGGRGITVCDRWRDSFENFLEDVGLPFPNQSIDRIDNDGNYEPGNVRWASRKTQANNTSRNRTIEHAGNSKNLAEWGRVIGRNPSSIASRLDKGIPVEEALWAWPSEDDGVVAFLKLHQ